MPSSTSYSDPQLREAVEYLLSAQNSDGSWGDPSDKDLYNRYHTTWTGQGAIQEFQWNEDTVVPGTENGGGEVQQLIARPSIPNR